MRLSESKLKLGLLSDEASYGGGSDERSISTWGGKTVLWRRQRVRFGTITDKAFGLFAKDIRLFFFLSTASEQEMRKKEKEKNI